MRIIHLIQPRALALDLAEYQTAWQEELEQGGHTFEQYDLNLWFWARIFKKDFLQRFFQQPCVNHLEKMQHAQHFYAARSLQLDIGSGLVVPQAEQNSTGRLFYWALSARLSHIWEPLAKQLDFASAAVISLGVTGASSLSIGMSLAHYIKLSHPSVRIVIGTHTEGQFSLRHGLERLPFSPIMRVIDGVIVHETLAAKVLREFAENPQKPVPGMVNRSETGINYHALQQLPTVLCPTYRDIPKAYLTFSELPLELLEYQMALIGNQCRYKCIFCNQHRRHITGVSYDPDTMLVRGKQTLVSLQRLGIARIRFTDDVLEHSTLQRFSDLLGRGQSLAWTGGIHDTFPMSQALATQLQQTGCKLLVLGLETGSDRVAQMLQREPTREVLWETLETLNNAGIGLGINALYGFPSETKAELDQTERFLQRAVQELNHPIIQLRGWTYARGSTLAIRRQHYQLGTYNQLRMYDLQPKTTATKQLKPSWYPEYWTQRLLPVKNRAAALAIQQLHAGKLGLSTRTLHGRCLAGMLLND